MKASFPNRSKIQKESNLDSLRQRSEGPGELRRPREALSWQMQFLLPEFPQGPSAWLEMVAVLKGFLHEEAAAKGHITSMFLG